MKNFLIFLSIAVVTILAATDLKSRMAELDYISKEAQIKSEMQKETQCSYESYETESENNWLKTQR